MNSNLQQLDELCMRFENDWHVEQPPEFLFRFLELESVKLKSITTLQELSLELCVIDLQRRWQAWNAKDFRDELPENVWQKMKNLPRVADYLRFVSQNSINWEEPDIAELKTAEFDARQKHGDLPAPSQADPDVSLHPIEKIKRPTATISLAGQQVFHCKIWGKLQVGRQAQGEPDFPCLRELESEEKLICAAGQDASISRNQFQVSQISTKYFMIQNTSTNRSFIIDKTRAAVPGSIQIVRLPLSVVLGDTVVRFSHVK